MKLGLLVVAVVSSSLPLLVACGGATQSDLFGNDPSTSTDQNGTDPTPGAGSTSSTSGGSSSSTSSTSSTSSSGGSTSSTSSTSGGGKSSGGTSTSSSGGTTYKDPGVWCGQDNNGADVFCASTQACCASDSGPGGPDLKCESKG